MSTTKPCPKCSSTLDALAHSCSQCHYLFKDICQQCSGAYPLAKLKLLNNLLICEDCLQKQNTFIQQGTFVPELSKKNLPKNSSSSVLTWIWAILPLIGTLKLFQSSNSAKKRPTTLLGFNIVWTTLFFYLAFESYIFYHQKNPSTKIGLLIQEIQKAQEDYKKKKMGYGMLEHLIESQSLPWKLEISSRQVFAEKEGYCFYIYLASKGYWKLKAIPKQLHSLSLKFYSDQSGQIRFSYHGEADETSLLWTLESMTFFHYLLQESWLSRVLHHYLF